MPLRMDLPLVGVGGTLLGTGHSFCGTGSSIFLAFPFSGCACCSSTVPYICGLCAFLFGTYRVVLLASDATRRVKM